MLIATSWWVMDLGSSMLGMVVILLGLLLVSRGREEAMRLTVLSRIVEQSGRLPRVTAEARDPELTAPLLQVNFLLLILLVPFHQCPCLPSLEVRQLRPLLLRLACLRSKAALQWRLWYFLLLYLTNHPSAGLSATGAMTNFNPQIFA